MTNEEYQGRLDQAREEIAKAQQNLLDTYLTQIRESYEVLPNDRRQVLLTGLDKLVQFFEGEKIETRKTFEPDKAKEIRQELGMTLAQVGEELGGARKYMARISNAERDGIKNTNSGFAKKYLGWLNEHGYQEK